MYRETLKGKYTPEDQHPWTWSDIFIDNRQILQNVDADHRGDDKSYLRVGYK